MTEAEWKACLDPRAMNWRPCTPRKLRLFACGCCRAVWDCLTPNGRKVVEVSERVAEGLLEPGQLAKARKTLWRTKVGNRVEQNAAAYTTLPGPSAGAYAAAEATHLLSGQSGRAWQCGLWRDLFPFKPRKLRKGWLTANDRAVQRVAEGIHADGTFDQVSVLGDALEEAGCTDRAILDHCRSGGVHAAGCWVVDLVLGKT